MKKYINQATKYGVILLTLYTYYIYFVEGGSEMVVVNILLMLTILTFAIKSILILIPMLIEEFKNTKL